MSTLAAVPEPEKALSRREIKARRSAQFHLDRIAAQPRPEKRSRCLQFGSRSWLAARTQTRSASNSRT